VTQLVVADGRDDECGRVRRGVLLAIDDDAGDIREFRMCLRGARLGIVVAREEKRRLPGPLALHREQVDAADDAIRKGRENPILNVGRVVCVWTPSKKT
jgi:hypothetical protein